MQPSINSKTSSDTDEASRTAAEVARKERTRSARKASQTGGHIAKSEHELNPALVAGLAVAALVTVAGVTVAMTRRRRSRGWLAPQRPSTLNVAARGLGMFLLRMAARQIAGQVVAKLDAYNSTPAIAEQPSAQASLR